MTGLMMSHTPTLGSSELVPVYHHAPHDVTTFVLTTLFHAYPTLHTFPRPLTCSGPQFFMPLHTLFPCLECLSSSLLHHTHTHIYVFFKDFNYLFLERGKGRGKERERNISVWLPLMYNLLGTWPLGMCPDWESNKRPLGLQAGTQSTEPHQPGFTYILQVPSPQFSQIPPGEVTSSSTVL